jgi:hypothetical protein
MRGGFSNDWCEMRAPHASEEAIEINRDVVEQFVAGLHFRPDTGHANRTETQKHSVASDVNLGLVYRELLTKLRVTRPIDSQRFIGLLLQIAKYLELRPDAKCSVYLMSEGRARERGLDEDDEILNLFQGPNPDRSGKHYPGDRKIHSSHDLTVQIHRLRLHRDGKPVADNVPTLAVYVPQEMSADWLVQPQGGSQ